MKCEKKNCDSCGNCVYHRRNPENGLFVCRNFSSYDYLSVTHYKYICGEHKRRKDK